MLRRRSREGDLGSGGPADEGSEVLDITFALPTLLSGGQEIMTARLASFLAANGHNVAIIAGRSKRELYDIDPRVRVKQCGVGPPILCVGTLMRHMVGHRGGVYLPVSTTPNLAALVARWATPGHQVVIPSIRIDPAYHTIAGAYMKVPIRGRLVSRLARMTYRSADAIVAVSKGVGAGVVGDDPKVEGLVRVINNPVVPDGLDEAMGERTGHPWVDDSECPVVLGLGRLVPQKGFDVLLASFSKVAEELRCRLVIVGEGPERERLVQLGRELGVGNLVSLPGRAENPYAYLARASVFVLSSRFEGFGNVVAEALAAGTPVVATDCPSGPREILESGRYGNLVPVDDYVAMSEAIVETIEAPPPPEDLTAGAERYRVDRIAEEYVALARSCLARRVGAPRLNCRGGWIEGASRLGAWTGLRRVITRARDQ